MEEEPLQPQHESVPSSSIRSKKQHQASSIRGILTKIVLAAVAAGVLASALVAAIRFLHRPRAASSGGVRFNSSGGEIDRTGFHFQPPGNWMNDPNAPAFYGGYYHLFYQFNPRGAVWDPKISWGHAVSADLIHWKHLPLALQPSQWYDAGGCWSGSMTLLTARQPIIVYTGISENSSQTQNAAVPEDPTDPLLRKWTKISANPLIAAPPDGVSDTDFRDPSSGWRDSSDSPWRIIVGGKNRTAGVGLLYESSDFTSGWRRTARPIFTLNGTGMWECPDFFPVSNFKYVFKVSLGDPSIIGGVDSAFDSYAIGTYFPGNQTFLPDAAGDRDLVNSSNAAVLGLGRRFDYGNRFYASKSFADGKSKDRRVLWGWLAEADSRADDLRKGWASVQSVPRSIWLDQGGEILMQMPVEEVAGLRVQPGLAKRNVSVQPGGVVHLLRGSQLDVEITFKLPDMTAQMGMENFNVEESAAAELCRVKGAAVNGILGPFGLLVLATTDLREQTAVFFHPGRSTKGLVALVCADHTRSDHTRTMNGSSLHGWYVHLTDPSAVAGPADEQELSLRVLVDRSVVETFAQGGKVCITSRVYPKLARGDAANLFVFNNGSSSVQVKTVNAWGMKTVEFSQQN